MAVYEYQAIARTGRAVKGLIDADSAASARRKLREQELHPTRLCESSSRGGGMEGQGPLFGRISPREVALSTRQLAVLLEAGMPLVEALTALLDQTTNARLHKHIYEVRDGVNEGKSLAEAMEPHKRVFSTLYVNMVRAGEASGALEQVLVRLADVMERQLRLKNKVVSLLFYPLLMALVGACIVTFLMVAIVPQLTQVFEAQEQELPGITKITIGTSDLMGDYWWAIALTVAGIVIAWRVWTGRPKGRRQWDSLKLRAPLFGALYLKMICVRFARTLGSMLQSGLTMMTALDVVKSVLQNRVMEEALDDVKTGVRRGRDLSVPLKDTGLFPPLLVHMVDLGQRSGRIEDMLLKVAETYDEDVELTVNAIVSLLEPMIIVVMAVFVGILVVSMLLPILSMSTNF